MPVPGDRALELATVELMKQVVRGIRRRFAQTRSREDSVYKAASDVIAALNRLVRALNGEDMGDKGRAA